MEMSVVATSKAGSEKKVRNSCGTLCMVLVTALPHMLTQVNNGRGHYYRVYTLPSSLLPRPEGLRKSRLEM